MIPEHKLELKRKLLHMCVQKQQALIDDFNTRIKTLLENEGLDNEEEYDKNEQANMSQSMEEVRLLNDALSFANQEMSSLKYLEAFQNKTSDKAEFGAVVVTDSATFFISISTEQFEVFGKGYIGLSTAAPLFLAMAQKRKGDHFWSHGTTYVIHDIF